jgi:hypothetical protein
MNKDKAISQLENLRAHCEEWVNDDFSDVWRDDVEALDYAIDFLKTKKGEE